MLFLIALIASPFISLCSHHDSSTGSGPSTPITYQAPRVAAPPAAGACPTVAGGDAGTFQQRSVTLPDLVGVNAQLAENQLKSLDLRNSMSSANPRYKMVLQASNWTVVSMYPPAGCTVHPYEQVELNVTKP
ncbi:hypothetical protein GGC64_005939 [Mycobacterium sp. OAS707]|nr:hypothetical protein [Mycobacterium sp. OAS707]